jgi:hypothetical protein
MMVKVHKVKVTGLPTARVAVSPGQNAMGGGQILAHVSAEDSLGIPSVVAVLYLNRDEARAIAARLLDAADKSPDTEPRKVSP